MGNIFFEQKNLEQYAVVLETNGENGLIAYYYDEKDNSCKFFPYFPSLGDELIFILYTNFDHDQFREVCCSVTNRVNCKKWCNEIIQKVPFGGNHSLYILKRKQS